MNKRKFNLGTVEDLFREDSEDEMKDSDDIYIQLAGEKFEENNKKKNVFDDKDDEFLSMAAEKIEKHFLNLQNLQKQMMKNSKKEMMKNKMMSMIRLRKKKMSANDLDFLSEYFFHAEEWPIYALEIIFDKDFTYQRRLALAAFFVGNGLIDPSIAESIYKIYNRHWSSTVLWNQRFREFKNLFAYLDKPFHDPDRFAIRMKYFFHDIQTNRTLYLNGEKKT